MRDLHFNYSCFIKIMNLKLLHSAPGQH